MKARLRTAAYAALVAAGAAASVQFWLRALTVRETMPASPLEVPAVDQREIPALVLSAAARPREPQAVPVRVVRQPALATWVQLNAPGSRSTGSGTPSAGN